MGGSGEPRQVEDGRGLCYLADGRWLLTIGTGPYL